MATTAPNLFQTQYRVYRFSAEVHRGEPLNWGGGVSLASVVMGVVTSLHVGRMVYLEWD